MKNKVRIFRILMAVIFFRSEFALGEGFTRDAKGNIVNSQGTVVGSSSPSAQIFEPEAAAPIRANDGGQRQAPPPTTTSGGAGNGSSPSAGSQSPGRTTSTVTNSSSPTSSGGAAPTISNNREATSGGITATVKPVTQDTANNNQNNSANIYEPMPTAPIRPTETTVSSPPPTVSPISTSTAPNGAVTTYTRDSGGSIVGTTTNPTSGSTTTGAGSRTSATTASPSVKDEAKKNQSMNGIVTAVSGVSAVMMGYAGYSALSAKQYPQAAMSFAMMAMSVAQMAASAGTSKAAGSTARQVDATGGGYDPGGLDTSVLTPQEQTFLRNTMDQLGSTKGIQGIRIDKEGNIVTPDGKKLKMADMVNPKTSLGKAFAAAVKKAQLETLSKAEKEALARLEKQGGLNSIQMIDDGTLGGGSGGGSGSGSSFSGLPSGTSNAAQLARIPANSFAGMSKNLNGEAIGVGADDIFKMIQRRYERKANQESFLLGGTTLQK